MPKNIVKVGICQLILFCVVFYLASFLLAESGVGAPDEKYDWLMYLVFGFVFFKLSRAVAELSSPSIIFVIYKGDFEQFTKDLEQYKNGHPIQNTGIPEEQPEPLAHFEFKIVNRPETALGLYLGEEFFAWIDVEDGDGNKIRLNYIGTISLDGPLEIKDGTVVIEPGIIYSVETNK